MWLVILEQRAGLQHKCGEAKESEGLCNNVAKTQAQRSEVKCRLTDAKAETPILWPPHAAS